MPRGICKLCLQEKGRQLSIFDGTAGIINRSLFGPPIEFQHLRALRLLVERGPAHLDGGSLVRELYDHTIERWRAVNGRFPRRASAENWRFTLNTKISERNASREKQVEKRIARLAEQGRFGKDEWANQIPVASGLLDHHADRKACVDLARRTGPGSFDLIELKLDPASGHALFAAMEALRYGVLYLFSRRSGRDLGYVSGGSCLLGAQRIRLVVLAPASYYRDVRSARRTGPGSFDLIELLQCLRNQLNAGLATECRREGPAGLTMEFEFEQFGEPFRWPGTDDDLIAALLRRHSASETARQAAQS